MSEVQHFSNLVSAPDKKREAQLILNVTCAVVLNVVCADQLSEQELTKFSSHKRHATIAGQGMQKVPKCGLHIESIVQAQN